MEKWKNPSIIPSNQLKNALLNTCLPSRHSTYSNLAPLSPKLVLELDFSGLDLLRAWATQYRFSFVGLEWICVMALFYGELGASKFSVGISYYHGPFFDLLFWASLIAVWPRLYYPSSNVSQAFRLWLFEDYIKKCVRNSIFILCRYWKFIS